MRASAKRFGSADCVQFPRLLEAPSPPQRQRGPLVLQEPSIRNIHQQHAHAPPSPATHCRHSNQGIFIGDTSSVSSLLALPSTVRCNSGWILSAPTTQALPPYPVSPYYPKLYQSQRRSEAEEKTLLRLMVEFIQLAVSLGLVSTPIKCKYAVGPCALVTRKCIKRM